MNTPQPSIGIRPIDASVTGGDRSAVLVKFGRHEVSARPIKYGDGNHGRERNRRRGWKDEFKIDRFLGHRGLALTYPVTIDATFC